MNKQYIGDKEILSIQEIDQRTPLGEIIHEVIFTDGSKELVSHRRYNIIVTHEISDASTVRNKIIESVGSVIYGLLHEYDLRSSEIDLVLNQAVELANAALTKSSNILWGVENSEDRTLILANKVLLENYKDESNKGDNGSAPKGEMAPASDKE